MKFNLSKRSKGLLLILVMIIAANFYLGKNYTVIQPGVTINLKEIVTVDGGKKEGKGSFFLTTVSNRHLNLPFFLYIIFTGNADIEKKEDVIPPGWNMKEYMEYMKEWMKESQKIAEVVALKKMGFNPIIYGDGAQIVEVMQDSPALGNLLPGDIIKRVDSFEVNLAEEVVQRVSGKMPGDMVTLIVDREGKTLEIPVMTMKSKTEKDKTVIGVYITTLNWKPFLPLKIEIDVGDIAGPSAGSMFAMEIINQISEDDIAKGKKVAGTGTINLDETIGEIGGVRHKVLAAYRDGAEIFFVPDVNAADARDAAEGLDIDVVSVKELDDIIQYLSGII